MIDTINSKQIADLTGMSHRNVLRKLELMASRLGETLSESSYVSPQNKRIKCYKLDLDTAILLLCDFGIQLRKEIINAYSLSKIVEILLNFDFDDMPDRFVYAAVDGAGRVKVGISKDPVERVKQLNVGNADKLELAYVKSAHDPGYLSESKAHDKLAKYNIRSEWFEPPALKELQ